MLDQYVRQGQIDALRYFGLTKIAMELGTAGPLPAPRPHAPTMMMQAVAHPEAAGTTPAAVPAPGSAGGGFLDKAKAFGMGQWGHAKSLASNLHQGLGGAPTAEAGTVARQQALGNLKGLAPSLLAGGALYMMHRNNEAKRQQQQMQQQAMMQGGY